MATIINRIEQASKVLVVCHIRPDGDCLGAGFCVRQIALLSNKNVDIVVDSEKPKQYAFLKDFEKLNEKSYSNYDLAIAVDCADRMRLGKYLPEFLSAKHTINIDHHGTNDYFAKENYVMPKLSSTCELLYTLLDGTVNIDEDIATYLYLGISTDTGNFMHDNTTSNTLNVASKLLGLGANHNLIVNEFYKNSTRNKLALSGQAISGIKYYNDNKIAIMTITKKMLEDTECVLSDTEGLIDYPMSVGEVDVAVCMTEQNVRSYKVSYRSKNIDVSASASVFGGGGHKKAAGCVVNGYYEDVVRKIIKSITDVMI